MAKLNNKGYMLVELILASAIAFGMAYFLLSLTMKIKDKNDNFMVESLTLTDKAIITNIIMKDIYAGADSKCSELKKKITINGNKFIYKDKDNNNKINIVNQYAKLGVPKCDDGNNLIIPLTVKQLAKKNEDFAVKIYY